MMRWDIINRYIKEKSYHDYLEIGYYQAWSFENVHAPNKTAVDPYPCKNEAQIALLDGAYVNWKQGNENCNLFKKTSDNFFDSITASTKFDIIFIDGLHEAFQVYKDIINSLRHLHTNGTIILHDLNPPTHAHTTTGVDGFWTGDTYAGLMRFLANDPFGNYNLFTVDTDWGVGVLRPTSIPLERIGDRYRKATTDWNFFNDNKPELLHLLTPEEFTNRKI